MFIKDPAVRRYVYGILAAAGAVALAYGILTATELAVWLALGAAVLGNTLAAANTNQKEVP